MRCRRCMESLFYYIVSLEGLSANETKINLTGGKAMNTINVKKRDFSLKAKQLRKNGYVPGSVFGGPLKESISLQIDAVTALQLVRNEREGSKLDIRLDEKTIPVQIKEKTVNTMNNEILHISFQALTEDQPVNSIIHIIFKNAEKLTAILEKVITEIPYMSLPKNMIDTITIDVDGMPVGTALTIGDIPEINDEKIMLKLDKEDVVLRVKDVKRSGASAAQDAAE